MKVKLIGMGGIAILGFAASALFSLPAMANGGDFFNELSESWGASNDTGVPYFGCTRCRGRCHSARHRDATVVGGVDGQAVTIISDNLGHCGSWVSAKRSIPDRSDRMRQAGYRTVSQDRRAALSMPKAL
jgi:hypothetical protein